MLELADSLRKELRSHCEKDYPHEACGLLLGTSAGARREVRQVFPALNLNRERPNDRFELCPSSFMAADEAARSAGLDIVGVYHSHPDHPSRPSATDLAHAQAGWSYLILSVRGDGTSGKMAAQHSWVLVDRGGEREFIPEDIR